MDQREYLRSLVERATQKTIDDLIDEWHHSDSPLELHEYLGMTKQEYWDWVIGRPQSERKN